MKTTENKTVMLSLGQWAIGRLIVQGDNQDNPELQLCRWASSATFSLNGWEPLRELHRGLGEFLGAPALAQTVSIDQQNDVLADLKEARFYLKNVEKQLDEIRSAFDVDPEEALDLPEAVRDLVQVANETVKDLDRERNRAGAAEAALIAIATSMGLSNVAPADVPQRFGEAFARLMATNQDGKLAEAQAAADFNFKEIERLKARGGELEEFANAFEDIRDRVMGFDAEPADTVAFVLEQIEKLERLEEELAALEDENKAVREVIGYGPVGAGGVRLAMQRLEREAETAKVSVEKLMALGCTYVAPDARAELETYRGRWLTREELWQVRGYDDAGKPYPATEAEPPKEAAAPVVEPQPLATADAQEQSALIHPLPEGTVVRYRFTDHNGLCEGTATLGKHLPEGTSDDTLPGYEATSADDVRLTALDEADIVEVVEEPADHLPDPVAAGLVVERAGFSKPSKEYWRFLFDGQLVGVVQRFRFSEGFHATYLGPDGYTVSRQGLPLDEAVALVGQESCEPLPLPASLVTAKGTKLKITLEEANGVTTYTVAAGKKKIGTVKGPTAGLGWAYATKTGGASGGHSSSWDKLRDMLKAEGDPLPGESTIGWPAGVSRQEYVAWKQEQDRRGNTENVNVYEYKRQRDAGMLGPEPEPAIADEVNEPPTAAPVDEPPAQPAGEPERSPELLPEGTLVEWSKATAKAYSIAGTFGEVVELSQLPDGGPAYVVIVESGKRCIVPARSVFVVDTRPQQMKLHEEAAEQIEAKAGGYKEPKGMGQILAAAQSQIAEFERLPEPDLVDGAAVTVLTDSGKMADGKLVRLFEGTTRWEVALSTGGCIVVDRPKLKGPRSAENVSPAELPEPPAEVHAPEPVVSEDEIARLKNVAFNLGITWRQALKLITAEFAVSDWEDLTVSQAERLEREIFPANADDAPIAS